MKNKINVFSAPMAGITDKPFRTVLRRFSDAPVFTEMISVETLVCHHPKTLKMLQIQDEKNIIVQLVGANPNHFALAAKVVEDMGAVGIDINMGCPVKKLIQNCSGAKLMQYPDMAARLVEAVKNNTRLPVSVKTRLGWDNKTDWIPFVQKLVNAGLDRIEIHTRTKEMGFSGKADWKAIASYPVHFKIPLIINGDIVNYSSAQTALKESHALGVMLGRALLGRPWVLKETETGQKSSYILKEIVLEHFEHILSYYGHSGIFVARKHLAWYAKGKKNVATWREKMYLQEDELILKQMIIDFFGENE